MSTTLADPVEAIKSGAPRLIHNDRELEMYTAALFDLTAKAKPTSYEVEAINLLTLLIENYEKEHFAIRDAEPVTVVRFLMEHGDLKQRDLIPEFGTESAVSMFLSGQRPLTVTQIQRLSARFGLSPAVFIGK